MIVCRVCKVEKPETEFFKTTKQPKKTGGVFYDKQCKPCKHDGQTRRRRELKVWMVEIKGGQCERCGHTGLPCDFDFHHRDPRFKESVLSGGHLRSKSILKSELKKCHLLCAICHRRIHFTDDPEWIQT